MDVIGSIPGAVVVLLVGIPLALGIVFARLLWRMWRVVRRHGRGDDEPPAR